MKLYSHSLKDFEGPRDNPWNTWFAINFFTSIGLRVQWMDYKSTWKMDPRSWAKDPPPPSPLASSLESDFFDSDSDSSRSRLGLFPTPCPPAVRALPQNLHPAAAGSRCRDPQLSSGHGFRSLVDRGRSSITGNGVKTMVGTPTWASENSLTPNW